MNGKLWKESASLIVLARNRNAIPKPEEFNYKVLVLKRSAKTGLMPSSTVFPGGVIEKSDSSRDWLKLYESLGVSEKTLSEVTQVKGERPPIFHNVGSEELKREISLRISCIRETFEELGVLICRDISDLKTTNTASQFAAFKSDIDVKYWQKQVHKDPSSFIELCAKHKLAPDIWGTHEWSAWLTPTSYGNNRRFEAAFYVAALESEPPVVAEQSEVQSYMWSTPLDLLKIHHKKEQWLPPPQHYELSRLVGAPDIDQLSRFAKDRGSKGTKLFFPIFHKARDGVIHLLPGDEKYPENPNMQTGHDDVSRGDVSMLDQRPKGPMHRTEHGQTVFDVKLVMQNFKPHWEHLKPAVLDSSKL